MKKHIHKIILAIALIVLSCVVFYTCSDTKDPKIEFKEDAEKIALKNDIAKLKFKSKRDVVIIDSIKAVKQKKLIIVRIKYDTLYNEIPDTLKDDLEQLNNEWSDIEIENLNLISRLDSSNTHKDSIIFKQTKLAQKDSSEIAFLKYDSIPKIYKKRFWNGYKKGFKHGTLTGAALVKGLEFGAKSIK